MNGNLTAGPADGTTATVAAPVGTATSRAGSPVSRAGSPVSRAGSPVHGGGGLPRREVVGMRVLGLRVWQLVAVEGLLAGVAVATTLRNTWVLAAAATVATVGIVVVLARHRHRPLLAWWRVRLGLSSRPGRATAPWTGDPRLAPLLEILPTLEVGEIALREGQRLAVCFDGSGWSAVVAVHRDADVLPQLVPAPQLPLAALTDVMRVDDIPLSGLQVLVHTVPVPGGRLPDTSAAAASYRQLGGSPVPAVRQTFVVLRLDASSGREAIQARGGGSDGARRALKRSASRLLELLDAAAVPARPLAETPWRAAVLDAAGLRRTAAHAHAEAAPGAPGGRRTREGGRGWQVDDLTHLTWWVHGWPDVTVPLQTLVELAGQVPAASTQLSFTLYPADAGTIRCRALLRTAARSPEAAETTASALLDRAAALGVGLQRLDREHGPGYLATLPLGGGTL